MSTEEWPALSARRPTGRREIICKPRSRESNGPWREEGAVLTGRHPGLQFVICESAPPPTRSSGPCRAGCRASGSSALVPASAFCHFRMTASKPRSMAYPNELNCLGDRPMNGRLDLGLLRRNVAERPGADPKTVANWEGPTYGAGSPLPLCWGRTAKVMFHRELARLIGVDETTVSKWEHGRHRPNGQLRARLHEEPPEVVESILRCFGGLVPE